MNKRVEILTLSVTVSVDSVFVWPQRSGLAGRVQEVR